MPNIKSAKKRVKVIAAKTMQNKAINSELKTEIKKANAAIEGNAENKAAAVRVAIKKIDQLCVIIFMSYFLEKACDVYEVEHCYFVYKPLLTFLGRLGIIFLK